ncbi:ATP-binding protein [Nocardia sp. 2]|uniref:ATP-binding protein n=1 Tax=Nocardia acididurans TaxID=2802282 RepID=A0ABS1M4A3_9NOCA|nr:ATP-binding protein [Nocardia acididurans]MBL1075019.1 ATP-binding protein [Nocardia acididurans]
MVRPRGGLETGTYRQFADDLVKFALQEPRAVIVEVDDLTVRDEPLLTAFTSAWMRVGEWPGVPIMLVAEQPERRKTLRGSAISRFLPVFGTVGLAVGAVDDGPIRRRAELELIPAAESAQRARRFVAEVCERWGAPEVRADAQLIATELVENAFLHSVARGDIRVRLELRAELLTVAVCDDDPREAVLREPVPGGARYYGLHVVARLARTWGCVPRWPHGKVVWAVLPTGARRVRC